MKKIIIFSLIVFSQVIFSQEEKKLNSKNGVEVSYQIHLQEEGKKKDKYLLIVNAINNTDKDIYYSVPLVKNSEGKYTSSSYGLDNGFCRVRVRNATGLFGSGKTMAGHQTKKITAEKHILYVIKKGEVYSGETNFKVKKGVKPLITNTFSKSLKKIEDFELELDKQTLKGDYVSSCGNFTFNITANDSVEKGEHLIQTVNGKQFIWLRENNITFKREDIEGYQIVYSIGDKVFKYSGSDGVVCSWKKK